MNRMAWNVLLVIGLFLLFTAIDLRGEDEAITLSEFLMEDAWPWLLLSATLAAASELATRYREGLSEREGLTTALAASRIEGARWRAHARQYSDGLGRAIRAQFDEWRLTASEADIAMLMLKGLSHKEVALLRKASPATVRQQAAAIYQKSGLASRAELSAFFLEDLFPSLSETQVELAPPRLHPTFVIKNAHPTSAGLFE